MTKIRIWTVAKIKETKQDFTSPILMNDFWIARIPHETYQTLMQFMKERGHELKRSESTTLVDRPDSLEPLPLRQQIEFASKKIPMYEKMDVEVEGSLTDAQKQEIRDHFKGPGEILFL